MLLCTVRLYTAIVSEAHLKRNEEKTSLAIFQVTLTLKLQFINVGIINLYKVKVATKFVRLLVVKRF